MAHFEVPEASARALFAGLRSTLSGIALPAFVRDLPGRASKTPMLALLVLLSGLALFGCSSSSPAIDQTRQPTPESEAGGAKSGTESVASVASESVSPAAASMVPMSSVDRVLSVDVRGGGAFEVLAASGAELRLGPWPAAAGQPRFRWSYRGQGMVQTWLAEDLDGDGKDELVVAFGQGRGFPKASLEVVLFEEQRGQIVSKRLTLLTGARNQATALAPWRRDGDGYDLYLAAFESRFVVRGGVLSRAGGEPDWLPGHSLRMGMARAVGDFDGDGRSDVAVGRLYGDQKGEHGDLRVLLGNGTTEQIPSLRGVRAVGAGDLNGDGVSELVFGDGWHINYGKLARYRPSIARRGASGWKVQVLEESAAQYAVEQIEVVGSRVVAGGNLQVRVYDPLDTAASVLSGPFATSMHGAFAVLPDRGLVVGGQKLAGPFPMVAP